MKYVKSLAIGVAVVLVAGGLTFGLVRLPIAQGSPSLPCEQLVDKATAADALARRPDLVARVEGTGTGVKVGVTTPCAGQPERALITIRYTAGAEETAINTIMRHDGFGVPAQLVKA